MRKFPLFIVAPLLALATAGCTAEVWEKVSPDAEGYRDYPRTVTAAHSRDDGSVVICVTGVLAATPPLFGQRPVDPFSLILPADAAARVSAGDHASVRRYVPAATEVGAACAEPGATDIALPIHILRSRDVGERFFAHIPEPAIAEAIARQPNAPAIIMFRSETESYFPRETDTGSDEDRWIDHHYPTIIYVDPRPRFDGVRAVMIDPGRRPVRGNPAYVLALPVAVVLDILTVPVFIFAVVTGIYDG